MYKAVVITYAVGADQCLGIAVRLHHHWSLGVLLPHGSYWRVSNPTRPERLSWWVLQVGDQGFAFAFQHAAITQRLCKFRGGHWLTLVQCWVTLSSFLHTWPPGCPPMLTCHVQNTTGTDEEFRLEVKGASIMVSDQLLERNGLGTSF
jgi:hypothetical protein